MDYLSQPAVTEAPRDQGPTAQYRQAGIERRRDEVVRAEQHRAPRRVTTLMRRRARAGVALLCGSGREDPGTPAFWLWTQVLRDAALLLNHFILTNW